MAFVIMPLFQVKQDRIDAFKTLVAQHARNSVSKEAACLGFDCCQDAEDPTRFVLYETYVAESALDAHRASDHYAWFVEEAADLVHPGPDGKLPQSVARFHRTASGVEA